MALTFSSKGCITAADELNTAKNRLDALLNQDLNGIMAKVKVAYQSEGASDVYAAFDKVKAKFPQFIDSVNECSRYLRETVAKAYEDLEAKISSNVK